MEIDWRKCKIIILFIMVILVIICLLNHEKIIGINEISFISKIVKWSADRWWNLIKKIPNLVDLGSMELLLVTLCSTFSLLSWGLLKVLKVRIGHAQGQANSVWRPSYVSSTQMSNKSIIWLWDMVNSQRCYT